jgi:hypothetical protein
MTQNGWNSDYNSSKGTILAGNGTRPVVLSAGVDGQILLADSTQTTGLAWTSASLNSLFRATANINQPNVTGDFTLYTVVFDTTVIDVNGDYDNTTGIFTAPYDGYYLFTASIGASNLGVAHTTGKTIFLLNGSQYGASFRGNFYNVSDASNELQTSISVTCSLSSSDTFAVLFQVGGGAQTVGLLGNGITSFTGYLIVAT